MSLWPSTLLSLSWNNIKTSFDGRQITITGVKNRASKGQPSSNWSSDDDIDERSTLSSEPGIAGGLADLLDTLKRLTERTRTLVTDRIYAERIFIGAATKGKQHAVLLGYSKESRPAMSWNLALQSFIQEHGLNEFTLKMLRPTEGEETYRQTSDPKAVQARLGHKHASVTRTHYTSNWMRRHGKERIGATQELYIRWAGTSGRTDPREGTGYERGGATPAFLCLDPYNSPRAGQQKGRLCSAYGECPACPLTATRPADPVSAAFYLALRKAIYAGQQGRISAEAWQRKWAPILADLDQLLKLIPPEIEHQISRYHVVLKPVG